MNKRDGDRGAGDIDEMEPLRRYLAGEQQLERAAVGILREAGRGVQSADSDCAGVDFAAHMLTEKRVGLRGCRGELRAYVWQAAVWFASGEARRSRDARLESLSLAWECDGGQNVEKEALHRLMLAELELLVARMPEKDRRLYSLCIVEGRTSAEAAAELGCSAAAARKRLSRVRKVLNTLFQRFL